MRGVEFVNLFRYCGDDPVDGSDPTGLLDTSASMWNHLAWLEGGSELSSPGDDLLRQGQAYFAAPTGNYRDPNVENHFPDKSTPIKDNQGAVTRYTVSDIVETDKFLVIKPTLDWWVRPQYKDTDVVVGELEHVNRWLYWQYFGNGAAAVRHFTGSTNDLRTMIGGGAQDGKKLAKLNDSREQTTRCAQ